MKDRQELMIKNIFHRVWEKLHGLYQVQKRDMLFGTGVLILLISVFLSSEEKTRGAEIQPQPKIPVRAAKVIRQDVENTISVVGTVRPVETVAIKSRLDSQIMQVNFKDGDDVTEGQILFVLDDRLLKAQLQQLTADLKRNEAELERATRQLERDAKLSKDGFTSQALFDTAKSTYEAARANLNSTKANMENIKTQLDFTVIKAPISGRVGSINITQGNTVKANDTIPLVTINQMHPIQVKIPIPQRYYQSLQAAMKKGDVFVTALDSTGAILDKGKILYKENAIDEDTRTLSVQAVFENKHDQLWPGMFVDTVVVLGVMQQVLTVPLVSVRTGQNSSHIFVVREGKAFLKPVKILYHHQDLAVIEGDVNPGEMVVTDGFLSLKDNIPVTLREHEAKKAP